MELVYLALPSVEYSHERVQERILAGGHSIPPADIERRFAKSLRNLLGEFSEIVDQARCFMNADEDLVPVYTQTIEGRQVTHDRYHNLLVKHSEQ